MNSYQLKRDHANKRRRDKEKAKTKVMTHIDSAMLTKHAVARARERSVSKNDIKQAFKNGKLERCGTTTYKVQTKTTSVVFDCDRKNFDDAQYKNTASVITVWAGPSRNRKLREQKRIRTGRDMRRIANQKKQQKREAKRRKRKERKRKNQGDPASASS